MSEPLLDPLKVHTFGVKRPLEEKQGEIADLYKNNKRYYPTDQKGELDEWGAVIKNQNEMFNRLDNVQKMQKRKHMEQYGHELSQEHDKRIREQKFNADQMKNFEYSQAMNKKNEHDLLTHQTNMNKKNLQSMLADDYEQAMRQKKMAEMNERRQTLAEGQASNHKAELELNYLQNAENGKKKMIQEILTSEKNAYDDRTKKMNNQSHYMSRAEAQTHLAENEKREIYRDYMNTNKYNNFNQFQSKANQNYLEQVSKPQLERKMKLDRIINKQVEETKRRDDQANQYRENAHLSMRLNNRATIEKQMREKRSGKTVGATQYEVDMRNRMNHEKNMSDIEYFERFKKKAEQSQYREMLNNQIKASKQQRLYGNMTGVEKSLNKDDLVAWKNYDHNTYALIPGLNSSIKPIPQKLLVDKQLHKRDRSYDDELNRINQFGFTRDVTLAKDPSYVSAKIAHSTK